MQKKTSFRGDVTRLVSGVGLAQLISIVTAPLLTRLFTPEAYGVTALFVSITGILGVIVCLRYELAIMLPESDREAANLLGASLVFAALISLVTVPVVLLARDPILRLLNATALAPYVWLVPISVFLSGVGTSLSYWNSRTKHFGRISVANIASALAITSTRLGFGAVGLNTPGVMIGSTLSAQVISTAILGIPLWRRRRQLVLSSINWHEILNAIKRHRKFPLYSTWSALLNTASWQLPVLLLGIFFSSTIVGFYALGFRMLQMPMSLIGRAIAQVFFQRAGEAKANGTLAPLVEGVFQRLVNVGLFPMLMLTIIGRDLYVLVFGESWAEAGIYTQILSVWAFFWFISSPLSTLFSILERQEFDLKLNIVIFLTRIVSLGIGGYLNNVHVALALFAVSGVITYGYLALAVLHASGVSRRHVIRILVTALSTFAPFGLAMIVFASLHVAPLALILFAVAFSLVYYAWVFSINLPETIGMLWAKSRS